MTQVYKRGGRPFLTVSVNTPELCDGSISDLIKSITESYLAHCEKEADRLYAAYTEDTDLHKRFRLRTKRMSLNVTPITDTPEHKVLDIEALAESKAINTVRLEFRRVGGRMLLMKCENLQQRNNI